MATTEHEILTFYEGTEGRILVADSLTYFNEGVGTNDVVVGASFAGKPTAAVPLARGVKAWIAHEAGVGKDQAGISGLPFAQQFGIPAAAIATMSARLSDGRSLLLGNVSHVNEAASALGVHIGQTGEQAAKLMLAAPPRQVVDVKGLIDNEIHQLEGNEHGGIYAVWSLMLVKNRRPNDVFCVASHSAKVMAEYASPIMPKGVFANDAGMGMDNSGIDGLPVLNEKGVAAVAVAASSARIGDPLSTYHDGICSAMNQLAAAKGIYVGMTAKEAARLLLGKA